MKYAEKLQAIALRKNGKSYNEILEVVKVSKSTLSLWLRDIKLSKKHANKLYRDTRQRNALRLSKLMRKRKEDEIAAIMCEAKKEIQKKIRDPFFISGLMLYWAEGDKSEQTELAKFTNSDPKMIKLMVSWFRKYMKVPESKFRIALHIHELHNKKKIEKYWSDLTKIPLSQFHKTQIKPTKLGHRRNKLYNGTCSIRIGNRNLFRRMKYLRIYLVDILTSGT